MRPNYAQDAPPTEISVGGFAYPAQTDFRVWLDVLRRMRDVNLSAQTEAGARETVLAIRDIQEMVFGGVLADENPVDVMAAVAEFSRGYPMAPVKDTSSGPVFSFEYDLNAIIIAIRNQSGIDLSYRRTEPFHWWEFLLEFRTLCGDHYILNLMDARGYKGKDKELLRRKYACALPEELTVEEQADREAFLAMFEPDYSDPEDKEE